jgi:Kae1-associated kinase Bud32
MKELIAQGAESKIYKENSYLIKDRIKKSYRLPELDNKLRKIRTKRERKIMQKASKIIPVPNIIEVSERDSIIKMDFINGRLLSKNLDKFPDKKRDQICRQIGKQIAILHNNDIIHGDLTTSNIILADDLYFIDFGLSFISPKVEDKAVDLHLLKQAFESKHYLHYEDSFKFVLKGYKKKSKEYNKIMERLEKVEKRGRYKRKTKN